MHNSVSAALIAAGVVIAAPAWSADRLSKSAYDAERNSISAEYRSDRERCTSLSGNAKDVCQLEARAREKSAKADAYARYKGTVKAYTDALVVHADADYAVAKEKCDDLAGNPKDVCVTEAKAAHTRAKVDAKANRKVSEVREEADRDKRSASYEVARERCDALAGQAKDHCIKDAKARFGKS